MPLLDLQEHQKEVEKFEFKPYMRSSRKSSVAEQHKSAITNHVVLTNHNIKWDAAKVIDSESDKTTRWVKEAIWIRRKGNKQRRGGIQIEQHLWSTYPHHTLNGSC